MGIPQFFRWLSRRYPHILRDSPRTPVDNLYLDLNGLIHPCFHPPGRKLQSIDQVFLEMFALMDRVIAYVHPRKLVYVAVDGSAPRAKLAQQRKRRFISAYERQQQLLSTEEKPSSEDAPDGCADDVQIPQTIPETADGCPAVANELDYLLTDSNAITPGTPFMRRLRSALAYYVCTRRGVTFVLDDCNSPGEGEHKIMAFIRSQRCALNYDPKTTHCIYGLDADLIMLALASHEPNFYILRDFINFDRSAAVCDFCGEVLPKKSQTTPAHLAKCPTFKHTGEPPIAFSKRFLTVDVDYFRKYLYKEFREPQNFERVIDDFVFLCFLAGNDFLPHIACLRIDDGGILRIIQLYNEIQQKSHGRAEFLTDSGKVNFRALAQFLAALAKRERPVLIKMNCSAKMRQTAAMDSQIRATTDKIRRLEAELAACSATDAQLQTVQPIDAIRKEDYNTNNSASEKKGAESEKIERIQRQIKQAKQQLLNLSGRSNSMLAEICRHNSRFEEQEIDPLDTTKILLYYEYHISDPRSEYYKQQYYIQYDDQKQQGANQEPSSSADGGDNAPALNRQLVEETCASFLRGMAWVCQYYSRGCCDWSWTYQGNLAPLIEDMADYLLDNIQQYDNIQFDRQARPFSPYEQLLAVLPPFSAYLLPRPLQPLMLSADSPLRAFYPNKIRCDASHAHAIWAAEVILPQIDVGLLKSECQAAMRECSAEEVDDNSFTDPVIVFEAPLGADAGGFRSGTNSGAPQWAQIGGNQVTTAVGAIQQAIQQAESQGKPLGRIINYQQAYNGFYGLIKRFWPPQGAYLAYKKGFKTGADFIAERGDRGDNWYAYLPEVATPNRKTAYRFSAANVREDFVLSRCLLRQDILDGFDLMGWERDQHYRSKEDREVWG